MNRLKFLKEGVKNLKTVGTITRSSRHLCKAMIAPVDFKNATVLVELGAGDGVLTKHILKSMRPDAKLLCFEVQEAFCEVLRRIDDPRLIVIEDSAENLEHHLAQINATKADAIISAIPFVMFPKEEARTIISICRDLLQEGGVFTQMHYSLVIKSLYAEIFTKVKFDFVPVNLPPAFVLICTDQ